MATVPFNESDILSRVLQPDAPLLSAEAAQELLRLTFPEQDCLKLAELLAKAKSNELTPDEQEELASYSRINSLLCMLKSKARVSLRAHS